MSIVMQGQVEKTVQVTETTQWVTTEDGIRLHLRTIDPEPGAHGIALLCLHGLFSDGRFFYNATHRGPTALFLKQGYRVFIGELRGHGHSRNPDGKLPRNWSFDDYIEQDIRCLVDGVCSVHQGPVYVLAHSFGGYALLAALGRHRELQQRVSGVCLFSSAVNDYSEHGFSKRIFFNLAVVLSALCGYFPARRLRLGVSDAPRALMQQFRDWARHATFCNRKGDVDYWKVLTHVTVPVWAAVGSADTFHASVARGKKLLDKIGSVEKTFVEAGLSSGFSRDFGHVDVIRGDAATAEILPRVLSWINGREADRRNEETVGTVPEVTLASCK